MVLNAPSLAIMHVSELKMVCGVISPLSSFPIPLGGAIFPRGFEERLAWFFYLVFPLIGKDKPFNLTLLG